MFCFLTAPMTVRFLIVIPGRKLQRNISSIPIVIISSANVTYSTVYELDVLGAPTKLFPNDIPGRIPINTPKTTGGAERISISSSIKEFFCFDDAPMLVSTARV